MTLSREQIEQLRAKAAFFDGVVEAQEMVALCDMALRYAWLRDTRGVKLPMVRGDTAGDARDWQWLFLDDADAAIDAALKDSAND